MSRRVGTLLPPLKNSEEPEPVKVGWPALADEADHLRSAKRADCVKLQKFLHMMASISSVA